MARSTTARGAVVPFTRDVPKEKTVAANLRLPISLKAYLDEHGLTETIVRAVEFDRALGEALKPHDARIDAFAAEHGMTREHNAAALLAKLVAIGLDHHEAEQGKKKAR